MAMAACDARKALEAYSPFRRCKVIMPEDRTVTAGQMCQQFLQHAIVAGIAYEPDVDI